MNRYEITDDDKKLIELAYDALQKAKLPDNNFHTVGACVRTKSGKTFTGVNCDCIHGSCGEFIAIGKAISEGNHDFDTIVIIV